MLSKSYSNLLELAAGDLPPFVRGRMPRVMTVAGFPAELQQHEDDNNGNSGSSLIPDWNSCTAQDRTIIVANMLPLNAERNPSSLCWDFSWDEESLLLRLKDGLPEDMEVLYIGCLNVEVEAQEQDEVAASLLDRFNCVPAFLPSHLRSRFYHGFCKQHLWPLFHYMLPLSPDNGGRFDRSLWQAYLSVNKIFADKVMEVICPDDDYVWIHDYHLMVLPTFLRKRFNRIKMGFFLHSPFPSSEIYRTLPVRDEILKALLNSDLIGFHTFDYARHFLSCCSRMLGLEYESKRGYIGLDYYGRRVGVKIMPVGIHKGQIEAGLQMESAVSRLAELRAQHEGKIVLLGVDDMDIFKGIGLKFLAMEELLRLHPELRGKAVLIQIANPARGRGKDVVEIQQEAYAVARRVNDTFGWEGYQPIVLLERHVPFHERTAYYAISECCVVTAVRDGMNLIPYEYILCREGIRDEQQQQQQQASGQRSLKRSMLVVSEFIGCSPSLSGAIRVNPWNIEALAEALNAAISMPEAEKCARHEKHYKYVSSHDVGYWAQSFVTDLERTCQDHARRLCYGIGFGLGFRVVALDPNFRKLSAEHIASVYRRCGSRAILLDYDGTMVPQSSVNRTPSEEVVAILNTLCNDPRNVVFVVSGRERKTLSDWFEPCDKLGLAAEHGFYYRWCRDKEWIMSVSATEFEWKQIVLPIMRQYKESTDGSFIEAKESAAVWHHEDADPDFGSWQAKELVDHLENVLANEPVAVKTGQHIVEVKPQGVSKGIIVERILQTMASQGTPPDFILCVGDDRSDEDMFESIALQHSAELFACTVGQKPSKAKYFVDDTPEVIRMLQGLAKVSGSGVNSIAGLATSFSQVALSSSI
ncbi:alpha,alpha-trehalose-phosphate synthase [UDP-forming] 5-like [Selaginella moellendorffii]|uniref:alpha,alpha-trehalose-phosphate synthase [UDP-forming] 5-like n=1 Tax=Selaginella moellendorffii TaxID=88036 RepID=UPI000D1D02FA|nr:alpha,alpha-trehalose-phosphate synthase [UDP-forming] 5-like [Selaginella moellendorffii]|eukprot:XP_024517259.1 alpha,alpha-trehalose-phosphate synthase [UDP-forming] 5-like [Selaginella moellendorffii]